MTVGEGWPSGLRRLDVGQIAVGAGADFVLLDSTRPGSLTSLIDQGAVWCERCVEPRLGESELSDNRLEE